MKSVHLLKENAIIFLRKKNEDMAPLYEKEVSMTPLPPKKNLYVCIYTYREYSRA